MNLTVEYITGRVKNALDGIENVYAAVLLGSCSRGEESWFTDAQGQKQLLSDYEFMIITVKKGICEASEKRLEALRTELCWQSASPFFNLEWNYYWKNKLPFMDKRFINFEMAAARRLIIGNPSVFKIMPQINVKNLNFSELNSIVNHRLYHVLKDYAYIGGHDKKYLIARNSLDITSVVLPYEGKLICSYQKRLRAFPEQVCGDFFDPGLKNRLHNYYEMKINYSSSLYKNTDAEAMLRQFISDMKALHSYQEKKQNGNAFCINKRLLFNAFFHFRRKEFHELMKRPYEEEKLYQDMLTMLEKSDFQQEKMDQIVRRVQKIYGYC